MADCNFILQSAKKIQDDDEEIYIFVFSVPHIEYTVVANYQDALSIDDSHKTYFVDDIDVYYWYDDLLNCYIARFVENKNYYMCAIMRLERCCLRFIEAFFVMLMHKKAGDKTAGITVEIV